MVMSMRGHSEFSRSDSAVAQDALAMYPLWYIQESSLMVAFYILDSAITTPLVTKVIFSAA